MSQRNSAAARKQVVPDESEGMSTDLLLALTLSTSGPWFSQPYVHVPAWNGINDVTVLLCLDQWERILKAHNSDVMAAAAAVIRRAQTAADWRIDEGIPALLLAG